jgi:hypothetical protein
MLGTVPGEVRVLSTLWPRREAPGCAESRARRVGLGGGRLGMRSFPGRHPLTVLGWEQSGKVGHMTKDFSLLKHTMLKVTWSRRMR